VNSAPVGASPRSRVTRAFASSSSSAGDRHALGLETLGQLHRVTVARQGDLNLPLGEARCDRIRRVLRFELCVFGVALGVGLRHRRVCRLPFLCERVPAVERDRGPGAFLLEDRADDALRAVGRLARVRVEKDVRAVRGDRDPRTELLAGIVLELLLLDACRELGAGVVRERDGDSEVLGHRYWIGGPPTAAGISGFHP
jgi:hypothetical protein